MRIAVAAGLLACFGGPGLWAQAAPQKLTVHRSPLAIPHKFIVHPSEATVPVNQTQQFEVTDADGRPVAVHWNVSGIGCSGLGCGTIDDHGVYRTPPSLPKPSVVTVEGVVVADPNYSVLTEVRLEDSVSAAVNPAPAKVSAGKTQPLAAPEVGREKLAVSAGLPPLPNVIAAAPSVGRQVARGASSAPLPDAVAPAPAVGRQLASNTGLPPLAEVIAAAPAVRKPLADGVRSAPLPNVVAAAPALGKQVARSAAPPPLPDVIAPAPAVGKQNRTSTIELPLANVIAAAPAVGKQVTRSAGSLPPPDVIAPPPGVGKQNLASTTGLPPLANAIAAAPSVGKQVARSATPAPLPDVIAPAPPVGKQIGKQKRASNIELPLANVIAAAPSVGKQVTRSAGSPPLPSVVAAAPSVGKPLASSAGVPPLPDGVAPAPAVAGRTVASSTGSLPLPNVTAAAPSVGTQNLASSAGPAPLPTVVAVVSPPPAPFSTGKTQQLVATAAGRQNGADRGVLVPMPDVVATAQAGTVPSAQPGPVVTYRDGQLTINAEGSTLAAVLQLIAEKTGAVIEIPPGSGLERIVEHTGPAPANDVLERLLNGSPFNFIIVSSTQNPSQPAQVLLSLHGPDTPTVASAQPKPASNPFLSTPPEPAPDAAALPYAVDPRNFQLPKEPLTPEAIGELMKEKGRQLREALQPQQ